MQKKKYSHALQIYIYINYTYSANFSDWLVEYLLKLILNFTSRYMNVFGI